MFERKFHKRHHMKLKRFFSLSIVLFLIIISCASCFNRAAKKIYTRNISKAPYDVIIVPGYPFQDSVWHKIMKDRVYWSHYLYTNGYARHVIFSGSAVYTPYIESKIMRQYALALGIPVDCISTESFAKHSTENLYYSYKLARNKGFTKIAVATDPYQNLFLVRFAKKNKLDVDFLPIMYETLSKIDMTDPVIDPSVAYMPNFVALPEQEGFFKRFKGTLGGNIDPTLY